MPWKRMIFDRSTQKWIPYEEWLASEARLKQLWLAQTMRAPSSEKNPYDFSQRMPASRKDDYYFTERGKVKWESLLNEF
ncbi:MAG: hypothetical protein MUP49_00875 [Dehalococcoidia bacterium]|nr:hypothetical protein [Dehalococcoidia bacterium]